LLKVLLQPLEHDHRVGSLPSRIVPIRNLETDEDTDDDNEKVDADRDPILVFDVFCDAAQQHFHPLGPD